MINNTMAIRKGTKDKHYGHCIVYPLFLFLWPLYCLSFVPFLMTIVLFILCSFSCGHCIVYPSFLFSEQNNSSSTSMEKGKFDDEEQTIQWP
jgi:hypothetical protein